MKQLRKILEDVGFVGNILGKTCILDDQERGNEIQEWLDNHPEVEQFMILDDDSDMIHLTHKLVKTDNLWGLTLEKVAEALDVLNARPRRKRPESKGILDFLRRKIELRKIETKIFELYERFPLKNFEKTGINLDPKLETVCCLGCRFGEDYELISLFQKNLIWHEIKENLERKILYPPAPLAKIIEDLNSHQQRGHTNEKISKTEKRIRKQSKIPNL